MDSTPVEVKNNLQVTIFFNLVEKTLIPNPKLMQKKCSMDHHFQKFVGRSI